MSDPFHRLRSHMKTMKSTMKASGAALVVMKDNRVVEEWYDGFHHDRTGARSIDASSRFNVYSVRVTYIALAAAICIEEGSIHLHDPLKDYLPGIPGEATVQHLLARSTGLKWTGGRAEVVAPPGTVLEGKRPDLVAAIIQKATGQTIREILHERLIDPMGWTHTGWMGAAAENLVCDVSSLGYPTIRLGADDGTDRNLFVNARELAEWGNLHLNHGTLSGKRIIPEEMIRQVISPVHRYGQPSFGYFWWLKEGQGRHPQNELGETLPDGSFQIFGASGCACLVIPEYRAVAVRLFNSLYEGYDYLADIRGFGDEVMRGLRKGEC
ncbi:serine hydrolase domain-containing protein [Rossellomorea marisflavi]|uniref:serine hydrolase domain-containing protein n=1 Tax=Rossellomorea marisflavi TaxID=189381 RepID=UPI003D2ED8AB